jgi:hypothetical protein
VCLDPHDLEQSLLRQRLIRETGWGETPDLVRLTEITRDVIAADLLDLARLVESDPQRDVAIFSGIVIHGPTSDWISPGPALVHTGTSHREHQLDL